MGSVTASRLIALALLVLVATGATYAKGVDVSNWQRSIDWLQVSSDGYTFAFAKATESTNFTDLTYAVNRTGATGVGVRLGAYHFARPSGTSQAAQVASAIAQADHFVDVAQPRGGDLPPALDLEANGGLKPSGLVTWTQAWLDEVAARTGTSAVVYASPSFWKTSLGDTTAFALASHRLWIAHWTKSAGPTVPASNWNGLGWTFWQWSNCVAVAGIQSKCVDADRANAADPTTFALRALPGGVPASATAPTIVGTARAGLKLSAVPGTWSGGKPVAFAYQWQSCTTSCVAIPGATLETYTPGAADIGKTLTVAVTASTKAGTAAATSAPTASVAAANGVAVPVALAAPQLTGTLQAGQTLTASTGTWSGNPTVYAYLWRRCDATGAACTTIANATTGAYTLTPGDIGSTLSVEVTATNSAGPQAATSPPSAPVAPAPVPAPVAVSLVAAQAAAGAVVTADGAATVTWQPGAVPVGTSVGMTATASPTAPKLDLTLTPPVATLPWPVELAYARDYGQQVVGYSTDGRIWRPASPLTSPTLPAGVLVGSYAGHIITREAGLFWLFAPGSWGDPTKVSRFAPRLRRVAPIKVQRLRSGVLIVSTRMTTPSQVLVIPSRRRILAPGSFPLKLRVSAHTRSVHVIAIDPYGRRGGFTLSFKAPKSR
jgi:GH25 family lysozyme M1 (1,4-beta-N-acetylmuramidase)